MSVQKLRGLLCDGDDGTRYFISAAFAESGLVFNGRWSGPQLLKRVWQMSNEGREPPKYKLGMWWDGMFNTMEQGFVHANEMKSVFSTAAEVFALENLPATSRGASFLSSHVENLWGGCLGEPCDLEEDAPMAEVVVRWLTMITNRGVVAGEEEDDEAGEEEDDECTAAPVEVRRAAGEHVAAIREERARVKVNPEVKPETGKRRASEDDDGVKRNPKQRCLAYLSKKPESLVECCSCQESFRYIPEPGKAFSEAALLKEARELDWDYCRDPEHDKSHNPFLCHACVEDLKCEWEGIDMEDEEEGEAVEEHIMQCDKCQQRGLN